MASKMQVNLMPLGQLIFEGITYVKLMPVPHKFKYNTGSAKRDTTLWICAHKDSSLPAQLYVVPEVVI